MHENQPVDGDNLSDVPGTSRRACISFRPMAFIWAATCASSKGTTGTLLNEEEVEKTRHHAMQMEGAMTVEQCQKEMQAAEKEGKSDRAKALARYLDELPKK
jgi:hypothetical protein